MSGRKLSRLRRIAAVLGLGIHFDPPARVSFPNVEALALADDSDEMPSIEPIEEGPFPNDVGDPEKSTKGPADPGTATCEKMHGSDTSVCVENQP